MSAEIFIDCFDVTGLLRGKRRTYDNIREAVLRAGQFSAFDIKNNRDGTIFTRLCADPELEITTLQYPWTRVELRKVQP